MEDSQIETILSDDSSMVLVHDEDNEILVLDEDTPAGQTSPNHVRPHPSPPQDSLRHFDPANPPPPPLYHPNVPTTTTVATSHRSTPVPPVFRRTLAETPLRPPSLYVETHDPSVSSSKVGTRPKVVGNTLPTPSKVVAGATKVAPASSGGLSRSRSVSSSKARTRPKVVVRRIPSARKSPKSRKSPKRPVVPPSDVFTTEERAALLHRVRRAIAKRAVRPDLGRATDDGSSKNDLWSFVCVDHRARRNQGDWKREWERLSREGRQRLEQRARKQWKTQQRVERKAMVERGLDVPVPLLSDADRARLCSLPRPPYGCKCGAKDHDRLDSPQCPLYRDLWVVDDDAARSLAVETESDDDNDRGTAATSIQRRQRDFAKRARTERKRDWREAAFVHRMVQLQLRQGRAMFVPMHLSIMVVSAVAHLTRGEGPSHNKTMMNDAIVDEEEDDDDDEDDDYIFNVPITSLINDLTMKDEAIVAELTRLLRVTKKDASDDVATLKDVLVHIGKTWGHIYDEPEHVEYAWHWLSRPQRRRKRKIFVKNPRAPRTRTFEHHRFILDADDDALFLDAVARTGLLDEVRALKEEGVLECSSNGLRLTKQWWKHVDSKTRSEEKRWGVAADRMGLFVIEPRVRDALRRARGRHDGVAEGGDSSDEDGPRRLFESKYNRHFAMLEGMGQFGLSSSSFSNLDESAAIKEYFGNEETS